MRGFILDILFSYIAFAFIFQINRTCADDHEIYTYENIPSKTDENGNIEFVTPDKSKKAE